MGETAQKVSNSSILSLEERRSIVRSFVNAYLRGSVKITLWLGTKTIYRLSTSQSPSGAELSEVKMGVLKNISIVSGATPSTPEIVNLALESLFDSIVSLRGGDFIEGEFLQSPDFEARISALEEKSQSLEKLLEDLQHIWKIRGPQA